MKLCDVKNKFLFITLLIFILPLLVISQDTKEKEKKKEFTIDYEVERTPVKDQHWTGTCWCFATVSFLESEILRQGGDMVDLSEMYIVRHTYPKKAENYVRLHGDARFSQGGLSHDVINQFREFGIVPEEVYDGKRIGENKHNHGEMVAALDGFLEGILKRRGRTLTPRWSEAFEAILNVYLGTPSEEFIYESKKYTPRSFAESFDLELDDYIELSSFTHHPFYKQFRLEIPDNWSYNAHFYNVPLDVLEEVIDHALKNGYSVAWDGDVSDPYFSSREKGYAIVPVEDQDEMAESCKEKEITQEFRQEAFNDFSTTDDHLMHIVGIAHDQNSTKFYLTKNSGGTDRANDGYVYMSRSYVRLRTTGIMVNKHSLPGKIKSKLGL